MSWSSPVFSAGVLWLQHVIVGTATDNKKELEKSTQCWFNFFNILQWAWSFRISSIRLLSRVYFSSFKLLKKLSIIQKQSEIQRKNMCESIWADPWIDGKVNKHENNKSQLLGLTVAFEWWSEKFSSHSCRSWILSSFLPCISHYRYATPNLSLYQRHGGKNSIQIRILEQAVAVRESIRIYIYIAVMSAKLNEKKGLEFSTQTCNVYKLSHVIAF